MSSSTIVASSNQKLSITKPQPQCPKDKNKYKQKKLGIKQKKLLVQKLPIMSPQKFLQPVQFVIPFMDFIFQLNNFQIGQNKSEDAISSLNYIKSLKKITINEQLQYIEINLIDSNGVSNSCPFEIAIEQLKSLGDKAAYEFAINIEKLFNFYKKRQQILQKQNKNWYPAIQLHSEEDQNANSSIEDQNEEQLRQKEIQLDMKGNKKKYENFQINTKEILYHLTQIYPCMCCRYRQVKNKILLTQVSFNYKLIKFLKGDIKCAILDILKNGIPPVFCNENYYDVIIKMVQSRISQIEGDKLNEKQVVYLKNYEGKIFQAEMNIMTKCFLDPKKYDSYAVLYFNILQNQNDKEDSSKSQLYSNDDHSAQGNTSDLQSFLTQFYPNEIVHYEENKDFNIQKCSYKFINTKTNESTGIQVQQQDQKDQTE